MKTAKRIALAFLAEQDTAKVEAQKLATVLNQMHALRFCYQTLHWGSADYEEHLLYQRLYESIEEDLDTLAEKMVGLGGDFAAYAINTRLQAEETRYRIEEFGFLYGDAEDGIPDKAARMLAAEQKFQQHIQDTYEEYKAAGFMPLGLDDFLMSLSSKHDTNIYLLKQNLKTVKQASGAGSSEHHFFDKPSARETREFAESGAISNDLGVAKGAIRSDEMEQTSRQVKKEVSKSPLTPDEVLQLPGGEDFATLNRYVITTEQPTHPEVPQSREEISKHPKLIRLRPS